MNTNLELFRQWAKNEFGIQLETEKSVEEEINDLAKFVEGTSRKLALFAAEFCGIPNDVFKKKHKRSHIILDPEVNGFAYSNDNWQTFEIGVNFGLMNFLSKAIKAFIFNPDFRTYPDDSKSQDKGSYKVAISSFKKLAKAFWEQSVFECSSIPLQELPYGKIVMVSNFLVQIERYVVAHEYGHVVIHVSRREVKEYEACKRAYNRKLSEFLSGVNDEIRNSIVSKWSEESGSDIVGLQLLMKLQDDDDNRMLAYASAELMFILLNIIEEYSTKIMKKTSSYITHPPALVRLKILREIVGRSNPMDVFMTGEHFESFSQKIIKSF